MATLYTIGHGRRSATVFVGLLEKAGIATLVDVRAFPASRRNPQFSKERLEQELERNRIAYEWQGRALGGFRKGGERSAHTALRHPMFRAYAKHMESAEFVKAATRLGAAAQETKICVMCAESDPAHCHRSLIADWLVAHGHRVIHLLDQGQEREHALNPAAKLEDGQLLYRAGQKLLL